MIVFEVHAVLVQVRSIEVPEEISLSLMEVLKASDYPILATCGGMALCATCQVEVVQGIDQLDTPSAAELEMLDQLPAATPVTRLSCQIRIGKNLNDAVFHLPAEI